MPTPSSRISMRVVWARFEALSKAVQIRATEYIGPNGSIEKYSGGSYSYLGGNKKAVMNFELIAPFPGAGNDKTLRWFTFVDVGTIYGDKEQTRGLGVINADGMRASAGIGRLDLSAGTTATGLGEPHSQTTR